jgi:pimeloyl-ACP methyl ester carboxylesterase
MSYRPETTMRMGTIEVEGLDIFLREAGKAGNPKLVLLHGFPASSHQYRHLMPVVAVQFHVIAMDYPGFGNSDMPDPTTYPYILRLANSARWARKQGRF